MAKCGDCLFCGAQHGLNSENEEHCCKYNKNIDYDDIACGMYVSDDHDCCYDCSNFKSGLLTGGTCKLHNKKITSPASWTCSSCY